ncbi:Inositol transporter 1 [Galdieria sulphuraria]|nr:Inositol transporter 1 [Galdieria sulphuraria]
MAEVESGYRRKSEEDEIIDQVETGGTELHDEKESEEVEMDKELSKLEEELQASGKKPFLAARIIPKPKIFIWFLASFASIGGLLFGLDQSLISGAELYIPSDLNIDSSRMSMITGFMALGAIFGALCVYPVNELLETFEEKQEFFRMETLVLEELEASKTRWILLDFIRRPRCRRAVVYAILLQLVVQQFSGINSVLYYMGPLMERTGLSAQDAVYTSLIGGGTMFLSTIPAIYFMDRLGRRPVLLTLIPGVSVGLFIVGFSFKATNVKVEEGVYILGVVIYEFFWGSCLGPTPWVVASEIYPTYLRSTGVSINALCNWLGTFTTTYAFNDMLDALTPTGTFVGLYNGVVIFGGIYLLFFMPETKNLTLEEMDELFERPTKDIVHENWENTKQVWRDLAHFRFREVWKLS